jgi:hypothetical protein
MNHVFLGVAAAIGIVCVVGIVLQMQELRKTACTVTIHASKAHSTNYKEYTPASTEDYIMKHMTDLNLDNGRSNNTAGGAQTTSSGCNLWKNPALTTNETFEQLHAFKKEIHDYYELVNKFQDIADIRPLLEKDPSACDMLELHPEGLPGIFSSQQLSFTRSGYVEPLLPPMRHPDFCFDHDKYIMSLQYVVLDFAQMCRKLKRHSRIVLVDMGASLSFHGSAEDSPAIYLAEIYRKFGMPFDHIYAYEMTPTQPMQVVEKLPEHLQAAYHWINVGVSADRNSRVNPFNMILKNYNSDDLIVIKLDIDTSSIEVPLATQILEDARLHDLVDQFFFEHHVCMTEIAGSWGGSMHGSIQESMELFTGLRKAGVAAHFWV